MWDGTGFFGLNTAKLGRLKGDKVGLFTIFQAADWVVIQFTGIVIILAVIIQEVGRYNTLKT